MMCAVVLDGPPINSVTVTVETMVAAFTDSQKKADSLYGAAAHPNSMKKVSDSRSLRRSDPRAPHES